jgi:hypothetical protein
MRLLLLVATAFVSFTAGCTHVTPRQREFDRWVQQFGEPDRVGYEIPDGNFVLSTPAAAREDLSGRKFGEPEELRTGADSARGSRLTFYYFARKQQVVLEPGRVAQAEPIDPHIIAMEEEGRRAMERDRPEIERAMQQAREHAKKIK